MTDTRVGTTTGGSLSPGRLLAGFIAGFLAVLIFHQLMLALLYVAGVTPRMPYSMTAVPPLGVPSFLSGAFWGGLWGVVFALVEPRFPRGGRYWITAFLFGAVLPTLVAWFIVLPVKGQPIGGGWKAAGIVTALLVNGAWGAGTGFLLGMIGRRLR